MYYSSVFDPWLIIAQIIVLQCSYYVIYGIMIGFFAILTPLPMSLHSMFASSTFHYQYGFGHYAMVALFSTSLCCGVLLLRIVQRAKKCLDFTLTLYGFHYLGCCYFDGVPYRWEYYITLFVTIIITVVFGEWLCMREELKSIPIVNVNSTSSSTSATTTSTASSTILNIANQSFASIMSTSSDKDKDDGFNRSDLHDGHEDERRGLLSEDEPKDGKGVAGSRSGRLSRPFSNV